MKRIVGGALPLLPLLPLLLLACRDYSGADPAAADAGNGGDAGAASDVGTGAADTSADVDAGADAGPRCDRNEPWDAPEPVAELNSSSTETRIGLTADLKVAYWQSERDGYAAIFTATRDTATGPFGNVRRVAPAVDVPMAGVSVTGDGTKLFFGASKGADTDLFVALRDASMSFGAGQPLTEVNSAMGESAPCVVADGSAVYFNSSRAGKTGTGTHLWVSRQTAAGSFGPPMELTELETTSNGETHAAITPDELTIYYTVGLSDTADIYTASRANKVASFTGIQKVDSLSTNSHEFPSFVTADQCEIYFFSDLSGNYDIQRAYRRGTRR